MTVGGRTTPQCARGLGTDAPDPASGRAWSVAASVLTTDYLVRGTDLNGLGTGADSSGMARLQTATDALRDRALVLADELGFDSGTWYVRVLEEGRSADAEADLGALVRMYWELQRVTGRADLRDEWRRLADLLWSGETS